LFPGIIGSATENMMAWGRRTLDLKGYSLKVLADNERAIRLYKKMGFREVSRIPLIQVSGQDGLEWAEAPQGYRGVAKQQYSVMRMS
jgi:RimJ/RimL family protein N-acetyltransferase